jgi:uncharacterized protein with GYD domain
MTTFLMFGKYSAAAIREISKERSTQAEELIRKFGGSIKEAYAVLGEIDLVVVVTLPGIEEAIKASVALGKLTGISFTTAPAVTVAEFDKLVAGI